MWELHRLSFHFCHFWLLDPTAPNRFSFFNCLRRSVFFLHVSYFLLFFFAHRDGQVFIWMDANMSVNINQESVRSSVGWKNASIVQRLFD